MCLPSQGAGRGNAIKIDFKFFFQDKGNINKEEEALKFTPRELKLTRELEEARSQIEALKGLIENPSMLAMAMMDGNDKSEEHEEITFGSELDKEEPLTKLSDTTQIEESKFVHMDNFTIKTWKKKKKKNCNKNKKITNESSSDDADNYYSVLEVDETQDFGKARDN